MKKGLLIFEAYMFIKLYNNNKTCTVAPKQIVSCGLEFTTDDCNYLFTTKNFVNIVLLL